MGDTPTIYFILRAAVVALNDGGDLLMIFVPKMSYLEYYFRDVSEEAAKARIQGAIEESHRSSTRKSVRPTNTQHSKLQTTEPRKTQIMPLPLTKENPTGVLA